MTEKEERVYQKIVDYYKENKMLPSVRELQKEIGYKSPNSIYKTLKKLEEKSYLTRNNKNKLILVDNVETEQNEFVTLKVLNTKEKLLLNLNIRKKYIGYKIKNDYFNYLFIKKDDYLIIERTNELNDNDIGLFIINKKYRIMEYCYKDGFYILKDNDVLTTYRVKIIGKVVGVYRKKI